MPLSDKREYCRQYKLAHTPEPLKRDPAGTYCKGYFFVTLNVHDRLPILGTLEGRYDTKANQVINAAIKPTDLGERVLAVWNSIPEHHPNVQLIAAQLMPEHFHGLLQLEFKKDCFLSKIIQGFKIGCTHAYWDIMGVDWRSREGTRNSSGDPRYMDKWHTHSKRGPALFEKGYNEASPITQEEIETRIQYIRTNPERRLIKGATRGCFTIHRKSVSAHWNQDRVVTGLKHDSFLSTHPDALYEAIDTISDRLLHNEDGQLYLDHIGNTNILQRERILPLVCHRADVDAFAVQREAVMQEARNGAVIVSAFISPKEREILHELIAEGFPVIELTDNGFSPYYKPY